MQKGNNNFIFKSVDQRKTLFFFNLRIFELYVSVCHSKNHANFGLFFIFTKVTDTLQCLAETSKMVVHFLGGRFHSSEII